LIIAGQDWDKEERLHYNWHRYYDSPRGRLISKDPIGIAGGPNVYQYAPNPVRWIDPIGLTLTPWNVGFLETRQEIQS
jgi:RHS repeat-associated protein